MSGFVRSSKFKHAFCDPPRPDATFTNIRLSTVNGEQNYIKANPLYFAVGLQGGGGPWTIEPINRPRRFETEVFTFNGHSSAVLDFEFNPFNDHIISTSSEDCTIKVWAIPEGGLTANVDSFLVDLAGHDKKVILLRSHPTAGNVLMSASGDQTVKLWDIEKGANINTLGGVLESGCLIQDIVFDHTGANYALSTKDKAVRFADARSATVTGIIETAHDGAKSTKLAYIGSSNNIVSVGSTRMAQRQLKMWDTRNLSREVKKIEIDTAAGVIMPFFDPDTNLLFLAGKGDGNVRFYEVSSEAPHVHPLSEVKTTVSAKGMAWVPRRGLNVSGCEAARLLKLTSNTVEPLSFFVPRKAETFQEDLYPPTAAAVPAHSADEWLSGSQRNPVLMSLNPRNLGSVVGSTGGASSSTPAPAPRPATKTAAQLQVELDAALARIKELEDRLEAAGLSV